VVFPYKSRTAGVLGGSLRLRSSVRGAVSHAIPSMRSIVRRRSFASRSAYALRGRKVGVPGELLTATAEAPFRKSSEHEEMPQV